MKFGLRLRIFRCSAVLGGPPQKCKVDFNADVFNSKSNSYSGSIIVNRVYGSELFDPNKMISIMNMTSFMRKTWA